jgi:thiol peroxidase
MSIERAGAFVFKGAPCTLVGPELKAGDKAPAFKVTANDLSTFDSASVSGKKLIISCVPSLDTGLCDAQTRRFNQDAAGLENVTVLTVSMDLPYAQKRWCGASGIDNVITLSDYKDASFGVAYGVLNKDWRLLARAVFVVDSTGTITHVEYLPAAGEHPNYDAAIEAVRAAK